MNNKTVNHFSSTAFHLSKNRSTFKKTPTHSTDFNTGELIPIYVDEILPGDTVKLSLSSVVRGSTPKFPVMDNAFIDYYAFFTPNRLVFDKWEEFVGADTVDYWTPKTEYLIPQIELLANSPNVLLHSPADYMGALGSLRGFSRENSMRGYPKFSALFPRVYVKTWNDWFRDENNEEPCHLYTDDVDRSLTFDTDALGDYVTNAQFGVSKLPVNKFHDYFTSSLPAPQKHAPITIPIGGDAPVVGGDGTGELTSLTAYDRYGLIANPNQNKVLIKNKSGTVFTGNVGANGGSLNGSVYVRDNVDGQDLNGTATIDSGYANPSAISQAFFDLRADLSQATGVTVDQLNLAIKTQYFYQALARGGSRYIEVLRSQFGVYASDSRLQRSEYLGGKRVPISQTQVAQTSSTTDNSVLGGTGAFSLTSDNSYLVNKSFSEHGILQIYCCVRTSQTYSQGQEKMFARRSLFDFYFPVFALIGEQGVKNKEIFSEDNSTNDEIFGYQEAWAEYRTKQNRVSGLMRPEIDGSLAVWNYANKFDSLPVLGEEFLKETKDNVARTLAVTDGSQWFGNFLFNVEHSRVMPVYSVPSMGTRF